MIKLTINIDDTIEKFSINDLNTWRCKAMHCFKREDISEINLSMTEKHMNLIQEQREKHFLTSSVDCSFEYSISRLNDLVKEPDRFFDMKIVIRK